MPGIRYVRAAADGGPQKGGAPRVVWYTLGADPQQVSARSAAQRLDQGGYPSHLVWNPHNGEIVQLIPIVRAGRSLGLADGPGPARWSGEAGDGNLNAEGRVCVQICVVARADEPFTESPMVGRREILAWLDTWGISRSWPAGPPAPFPECYATVRSRRLWSRGGHFGASQVPVPHFGGSPVPGLHFGAGPGAIDPERLTGWPAAKGGHLAPAAVAARTDGLLHPAVPHAGADYDPPDLGELIAARSARPASLSRVH
jgi:hypothetical protein